MVDVCTNATAALLCWSFTPSDRPPHSHSQPPSAAASSSPDRKGWKERRTTDAAAAAAENNNSFALLAYCVRLSV